jgi:hydrogenase nickel incorporation protein HypA/HybF
VHEFSIALSIVDIAREEVNKNKALGVEKIDLEIGKLSGVEVDSLKFVWEPAVKDTVLEDAKRDIDEIEGVSRCQDCDHIFPVEYLFNECPACGSQLTILQKGRELRVKSLTLKT